MQPEMRPAQRLQLSQQFAQSLELLLPIMDLRDVVLRELEQNLALKETVQTQEPAPVVEVTEEESARDENAYSVLPGAEMRLAHSGAV
jgi:DNA-directed RNA polymerase specialized sigma54-like protein